MTAPNDAQALYNQVCMAAEDYVITRNAMMAQPLQPNLTQLNLIIAKADKVMGLLAQLRARRAVTFATAPEPAKPQPQPQPTVPQFNWQCGACHQLFSTATNFPPASCPLCGTKLH